MDLEGFKQRVRRNYYQRHKYWFVSAAAGILGMIAFDNSYFLLLSGVSLILSGVAVIRAGKGPTNIGITGWGGSVADEWSTSEFADMSPDERVHDANSTGGFLILIGSALLALMAYSAWLHLREYWAASEYEAMAHAAGLVSRVAPSGLAASSEAVCWSDARSVTMCSEPGLVEVPQIQRGDSANELVYTPRGLVLASDLGVTWLPISTTNAVFLRPPQRVFDAGAKALTALDLG